MARIAILTSAGHRQLRRREQGFGIPALRSALQTSLQVLALATGLPPAAQAGIIGLDEAPAQLWRKSPASEHPLGVGSLKRWPSDFGVIGGHCNTTVLGKLMGGRPGNLGGDPRLTPSSVAMLIGVLPAATAGSRAGRQIDAIDRGCIGHTLEMAPSHHAVRWVNVYNRSAYIVTPLRSTTRNGVACREFSGEMTLEGRSHFLRATACRAGTGVWRIT